MKFKYYITNLFAGQVDGTDSDADAENLANCEDFFVVNAETGMQLLPGGEMFPVSEVDKAD